VCTSLAPRLHGDPAMNTQALSDATSDLLPRIERFCKARPWAAIGIGVALGALLRIAYSR
jgi:ElaB/YqjD/DUF883 family membrane-anchored ribosome-binding protein